MGIAPEDAAFTEKKKRAAIVVLHEIFESELWGLGKDIFRYDEFLLQDEIKTRDGVWEKVSDESYYDVGLFIGKRHGMNVQRDNTKRAVDRFCRAYPVDSLKDYLHGLVWDGTERLTSFLPKAFGVKQNRYASVVGAKFIESMVARGLKPGCKQDYCPIFISDQGVEKSKALRALGGRWFTDVLPHTLSGRSVVYALQGVWLIEACELAAFTKAEKETLKAFIDRRVERTDLKFRNTVEEFPRRCVIAGTTNQTDILKDETGGRRFWPIECGVINVKYIEDNRDQLFAEAVRNHKGRVPWWPDAADEGLFKERQDVHYAVDAREDAVASLLERSRGDKQVVTMADIFTYLGIPITHQHMNAQKELGAVLKHLGYDNKQRWFAPDGTRPRVWLPKNTQINTTGWSLWAPSSFL